MNNSNKHSLSENRSSKFFISYNFNDISDVRQTIKNNLLKKYCILSEYQARYDFEIWEKIEESISYFWDELYSEILTGIELNLYEEISKIFFEIRNYLQATGHISERIHIATWIYKEAELRNEYGIKLLALSTLIWSYTSSGCHQDIEKANQLFLYLQTSLSEFEVNDIGANNLIYQLGSSLFTELVIEAKENGIRIAIRKQDFDNLYKYTLNSRNLIDELYENNFISIRLKKRFEIAVQYHESIALYLQRKFHESKGKFELVISDSKLIGWNRAEVGARSWLATLAIFQEEYQICTSLLDSIDSRDASNKFHKRDAFLNLIKAKLFSIQGKSDRGLICQEYANFILKRCISDSSNCTLDNFRLLSPI